MTSRRRVALWEMMRELDSFFYRICIIGQRPKGYFSGWARLT